MNVWTLTTTCAGRAHTTIGTADSAGSARRCVTAAAQAVAARAGAQLPTYRLTVDDRLVAVVRTGFTDSGLPDHAGVIDLLRDVHHVVDPYAS